MYRFTVNEDGIKLVDFISDSFNISKNSAKSLIDSKLVFVNGQRVWIAKHLLNRKDVVEYAGEVLFKKDIELDIIYEDNFIFVLNKPPFIVTNEAKGSLEELLKKEKGSLIRAIHRLDKETSGVILFAKNDKVFEKYKELWKKKEVRKIYHAICYGEVRWNEKWINEKIDGKPAVSYVKVLKTGKGISYLEVEILTGRKHQVRKHLALIRHPILGDKENDEYFIKKTNFKNVKRQLLHSYKIEFVCPFTGEEKRFFAPIPKDFKEILEVLR